MHHGEFLYEVSVSTSGTAYRSGQLQRTKAIAQMHEEPVECLLVGRLECERVVPTEGSGRSRMYTVNSRLLGDS